MFNFQWYNWMLFAGQIICGAICLRALISSITYSSRNKRIEFVLWSWRKQEPSEKWLRFFRIDEQKVKQSHIAILWAGCGLETSIFLYMVWRQAILWICYLFIVLWLSLMTLLSLNWSGISILVFCSSLLFVIALHTDQYWLRIYREMRAISITKEIHAISGQLLYFADSKLHIHTKLRKCLPYSRLLRKDIEILLADWYHDPALALHRFKQSIGTEEGISFVDTLDALRQHDNEEFYSLLRTRMLDYKDTLELAKEGRKETTSYLLFVISGIPILYTFQVFIYPWVQEVNKLLSLMN